MSSKYLIAGLVFAASVIIAVVFVYPNYQIFTASEQLAANKQNELDAQTALINEINKAQSRYKKAEDELLTVSDLLPVFNQKSIADLFVEMENIASESGVLMNSINFGGETMKSDKGYKTIDVKLSALASYDAFKKFAAIIEKNRHLMDMTAVSITAGASNVKEKKTGGEESAAEAAVSQPEDQAFTYSVSINVYYQ